MRRIYIGREGRDISSIPEKSIAVFIDREELVWKVKKSSNPPVRELWTLRKSGNDVKLTKYDVSLHGTIFPGSTGEIYSLRKLREYKQMTMSPQSSD